MDQNVGSFIYSQNSNDNRQSYPSNNNNIQHTSINVGISNMNPNTSNRLNENRFPNYNYYNYNGPNITFECYLPLPNDMRIYHVRYTELHPLEIAQLLNDGINLPHIPDCQLPNHYNIQSLIQQQIQQQVQQSVKSQIYQQNNTQQVSSNIEDSNYISGIFGMDNYNAATTPNVHISDNTQDIEFNGVPDMHTTTNSLNS